MLKLEQEELALEQVDPEVAELIREEERYQAETIRLIASENYASAAVIEASGSVLTNKYSEGYPGKRYYEGQRYIDRLETLVQERAKRLFGVEHANVQPYSGSPANLAAYDALLDEYEPGGRSADIDALFARLAGFLPGFLARVLEHQARRPAPLAPEGPFAIEAQRALGLRLMAAVGFDFDHGRLDVSDHPFTGGTPDDVRITTRYHDDDFTQG
ncbi:MAG: hypothetical protein IIC26_08765, partial [Chloroflexi bacterium]|nr:hypothetical protein [Chloroflexota bacterium]